MRVTGYNITGKGAKRGRHGKGKNSRVVELKLVHGVGALTQKLRERTALPEDLNSMPSIHTVVYNHL